jgi:hypothetical protein
MATHSLQNFWLVDGLWHLLQYLRPQLLHSLSDEAFFPQISQVFFTVLMDLLRVSAVIFQGTF